MLVNGNITQTVTDLVRVEALRHVRPGTEVTAVTATFGVPIVSTELENTIAGHAVPTCWRRMRRVTMQLCWRSRSIRR